jgi:hypothetical protein
MDRTEIIEAIRDAMRAGSAERFWPQFLLADHELTADLVPSAADWGWPSLVQSFALLFDRYARAEVERRISALGRLR